MNQILHNIKYTFCNFFGLYQTFGGVPRSSQFRVVCKALFGYLLKECKWCGSRFFIQVHHFEETYHQNPARENDPTNLIPLCAKCHLEHGHRGFFQSLETNFIARLEDRMHRPLWNGTAWIPSRKEIKYKMTQEDLDQWNKRFGTNWQYEKVGSLEVNQ